jgi:AbrB family looped-hinge helix DNA binding protein
MPKKHRAKKLISSSERFKKIVAERGQVTIPKKLRDKLGLLHGTPVNWELKDSKIYLTKESDDDITVRIKKVRGIIKDTFPYASTDEYINEIRGPAVFKRLKVVEPKIRSR